MNVLKRRGVSLTFLFLAVLVSGTVLKETVVPRLLRRRLTAAVHDNCKTCELSLGRVDVSLLPLALKGRHVFFTGGEMKATLVKVKAEGVYIPFSFFPLLKGHVRTGLITIERPEVSVIEGDQYAASSTEAAGTQPLDLEIEGVEMKNAAFTYARNYPGRTASFGISRLNAAVGTAGSSARLRGADVEAGADGLLEGSGRFRLHVRAKLFPKAPDVDVNLRIAGQDLAKMNRFFEVNDGVDLHGLLIDGLASVAIRGAGLTSAAYVRYSGLGVKFEKNKDRGSPSAFFQNLLASVMTGKQNVKGGKYDRRGAASLARKPKETLVSFALRGMKEAAMKVASQGGK